MRWNDVNLQPNTRVLRQFGGILAIICALTAYRNGFDLDHRFPAILLSVAAALFAIIALTRPNWLKVLFVASIVITFPIGWLVSNVILSILFFGLMTPLAIVFRWSGRDLLNLKPASPSESTFWSSKSTPSDKRSYFRQF